MIAPENPPGFVVRTEAQKAAWDTIRKPSTNRIVVTAESNVSGRTNFTLPSRTMFWLPGRVYFGGALSGRDQNAVNKTVSGLLKLIYPDPAMRVADEDLEWAVRLGL